MYWDITDLLSHSRLNTNTYVHSQQNYFLNCMVADVAFTQVIKNKKVIAKHLSVNYLLLQLIMIHVDFTILEQLHKPWKCVTNR